MKKAEKRGLTNVEMIVAVTIFVFSIVLVVYYITFVGFRQEPPEIFLATLERSLRNETEISYNVTTLGIDAEGDCFKIPLHSSISGEEKNVSLGAGVYFNISGGHLIINKSGQFVIWSFPLEVGSDDNRLGACTNIVELTKGKYNYSIAYQDKVFIFEKLSWLKNNYQNFKTKYNLQKDFTINVTSSSGPLVSIVAPTKPLEAPVKAKQFPATIMSGVGGTLNVFDVTINMMVW